MSGITARIVVLCVCLCACTAQAQQVLLGEPPNDIPFGKKMAFSRDQVAIAAPSYRGNVGVYRAHEGQWILDQNIPAQEGMNEFGYALAMSDRWLAIAWRDYTPPSGAHTSRVDMYRRSQDAWHFVQRLPSPVTSANGYIRNIALSESSLVVSEDIWIDKYTVRYEVRVVEYDDAEGWGTPQLLSVPGAGNTFGYAISASNDTLAITDLSRSGSGAVVIFEREAGRWQEVAVHGAPSTMPSRQFGQAVAVCGTHVAVHLTAPLLGSDPDRIVLFRRSATGWGSAGAVEPPSSASPRLGQRVVCNEWALAFESMASQAPFFGVPLHGDRVVRVLRPATHPPIAGTLCGSFAAVGSDLLCGSSIPSGLPAPQPSYRGVVYAFPDIVPLFASAFD